MAIRYLLPLSSDIMSEVSSTGESTTSSGPNTVNTAFCCNNSTEIEIASPSTESTVEIDPTSPRKTPPEISMMPLSSSQATCVISKGVSADIMMSIDL